MGGAKRGNQPLSLEPNDHILLPKCKRMTVLSLGVLWSELAGHLFTHSACLCWCWFLPIYLVWTLLSVLAPECTVRASCLQRSFFLTALRKERGRLGAYLASTPATGILFCSCSIWSLQCLSTLHPSCQTPSRELACCSWSIGKEYTSQTHTLL